MENILGTSKEHRKGSECVQIWQSLLPKILNSNGFFELVSALEFLCRGTLGSSGTTTDIHGVIQPPKSKHRVPSRETIYHFYSLWLRQGWNAWPTSVRVDTWPLDLHVMGFLTAGDHQLGLLSGVFFKFCSLFFLENHLDFLMRTAMLTEDVT